MMFLAHRL